MDVVAFREYCLSKPNVTESLPFDENTLVFKLNNKMFALIDIEPGESCNLKCDPERSLELRSQYQAVHPGYHMNKKHWNTIMLQSDVDDRLMKELIDHSYQLVFNNFSKKIQKELLDGH
ncbi:MAG: MmcQ-like protein [Fluviicola sp.]|nr:MAG: MmcQ-like protein [Fluviicola sp.]